MQSKRPALPNCREWLLATKMILKPACFNTGAKCFDPLNLTDRNTFLFKLLFVNATSRFPKTKSFSVSVSLMFLKWKS